jgi:hypothetical protein
VRQTLLFPILEALHSRYKDNGGVKLFVQTTGDVLTDQILDELLEHHVWHVSVSGIDSTMSDLSRRKRDEGSWTS